MTREEILNTLTNARNKSVNCFMLLRDYENELKAKDGKIYDSRVKDIEKYLTISGEKWVYRAHIYNAGFSYARFDFYFSKLNEKGYTIYGTNDCINGEYLGEIKWTYRKDGKTKEYFNYSEIESQIDRIKVMIMNDVSKTTEIIDNLGDYMYHINALREEQKKIIEKLSVYTKPRAYFNNKNLGEMVR